MKIDKYESIKKCILEYAREEEDVKAIVAIGSFTREDAKADEYSDLDLIIVTEKPEQFVNNLKSGVAQWIMNRGYYVIYESGGYTEIIKRYVSHIHSIPKMSETEYINVVNDFYFHNIWACKKLRRGEVWAAKMCVDSYLKNYLLKMIELYCFNQNGIDVWHDGRFLDKWADEDIINELKNCFAHYDSDDIMRALWATHNLFDRTAKVVAQTLGYKYPNDAKKCAEKYMAKEESEE